MTAFILTAARFPEQTVPAAATPRKGLTQRVIEAYARRRTIRQLTKLDAEQLFDIGLTRADVNAIRAGGPVPTR